MSDRRSPPCSSGAFRENELVPLSVVTENIPHITLLWKDARGTVRLYDSDDVRGSHVMPRGSAPYNVRMDAWRSWRRRGRDRGAE